RMRALTVEPGPVEARSVEFSEQAVQLAGIITRLRQLSVAPLVERAAQDLAASVVLPELDGRTESNRSDQSATITSVLGVLGQRAETLQRAAAEVVAMPPPPESSYTPISAADAVILYARNFIPSWAGAIAIDLLPAVLVLIVAITQGLIREGREGAPIEDTMTIAELRVRLADAALSPSVSLNGSLGLSDTLNTAAHGRSATVGIGASQTIYAGGRLSSLQRQAMQNRDADRANLHVVSHNIRQNVGNALATLQVAQASIQASQQQVRAAQVAFRGVREEATLGARTTLDVLNAEQELLDARANLISAQVDELSAGYNLLAAMGELTAQKLKLKVRIYDPAGYYNLVKDAPAGRSEQGQKLDRVLRRIGKE
ncbi:MAG: TolC family protein, partial [Pseudomonadota bacterium]|nr:TolC family protein [Pseudomonadota bacterium]